jgi:hypothetical protein
MEKYLALLKARREMNTITTWCHVEEESLEARGGRDICPIGT